MNEKKILHPSYSVLQDDFFRLMRDAGYTDVERGQRGSTEEHLTVTQFKVQAEQERLAGLKAAQAIAEAEIDDLEDQKKAAQLEAKEAAARMKELAPAVKNEVYYNAKDPTAEVYTHDTKLKKRFPANAT